MWCFLFNAISIFAAYGKKGGVFSNLKVLAGQKKNVKDITYHPYHCEKPYAGCFGITVCEFTIHKLLWKQIKFVI